MNRKNFLLQVSLIVVLSVGFQNSFAQYPKIPGDVQKWSDSLLDAARKHSDEAWAKALPAIDADARNGKPYIPWASRPSDLQGWYRNRLRIVLRTGAGLPNATDLKNPNSSSYRDVQNLDNMMTNYFTTIRNNNHDGSNSTTKLDANPINFKSTYYFFPIPLQAITNNPNLKQNVDWGGTFDPVQ